MIYSYHTDSSLEIYMKKVSFKELFSTLITVNCELETLIKVSEKDHLLLITSIFGEIFSDWSSKFTNWFRIVITFDKFTRGIEI